MTTKTLAAFLLVGAASALTASSARASTLTFNGSPYASGTGVPFGGTNLHDQFIYNTSVLTPTITSPISISELQYTGFATGDAGSTGNAGTVTIRIGVTSSASYASSTFLTSGLTTVYSSTAALTFDANNHLDFAFSTPFTFDPTLGNLVVDITNSANPGLPTLQAFFSSTNVRDISTSTSATTGTLGQTPALPTFTYTTAAASAPEPDAIALIGSCFGILILMPLRRRMPDAL